ncbi:MAG: hypothetical protein AABY33_06260 [Pseudomonadota bacterium]
MVDERDEFGNPKVSPDHNVLTVEQDARRDGVALVALADKDKTMARMREEALGERDKFARDYPHEADKLPQFDEGDPLRYRDAILAMRSAKEGEQITQNLGKAIGAAIGLEVMSTAANGGMLPAGAGVFSPEVLARQKAIMRDDAGVLSPEELEKRKDPIKFNAELEKILKEGGIDKEKLARTGVKTDGQDVDKGQNFVPTEVPNLKAAVAKQQESSGFERSRTA